MQNSNISFYNIFEGVTIGISAVTLVFSALLFTDFAYNPHNAIGAIVYIVTLLMIPLLIRYQFKSQSEITRRHLVILSQSLVLGNLLLNGWGSLGWYGTLYNYDDFVHFISPVTFTYVAAAWLLVKVKHGAWPWQAMLITAIVAIIWEPIEYYGDQLVGSQTYGQIGQPLDTWYDLIADAGGVIVGALLYRTTRQSLERWLLSK